MNTAQKIRIMPDGEQEVVLRKACGTSRYTYNWGLSRWKELKSQGQEKVFKNDLKKEWNQIKPEWVYEVPKDANQQPFTNLYNAFSRYYIDKKSGKNKVGFPTKKKKGHHDSFYVSNDKAHVTNNHIKLPKIGRVKMVEQLRYRKKDTKILSYTVSRQGIHWYVSLNMEVRDKAIKRDSKPNIIGIDVGLKTFAVTSKGEKFESPKPLKKYQKKLKRLQRQLSRKKKRSRNRLLAIKKVAKLHSRITNTRKDFLHKLSHKICSENKLIVIENLNIKGMLKNHKLALNISDAGWSEFSRQLGYKAKKFNSVLIKADRWFASTKTCSNCGCVKDHIGLDERVYLCDECAFVEDRDINSSTNLLAWGLMELIPGASGKFTPVEIVALAHQFIDETTTINEALGDLPSGDDPDSHPFITWLRNKVDSFMESSKKNEYTFLHFS